MNTMRPPKARPELTVDIVIFTLQRDELVAILAKRTEEPFAGELALPGGYVWQGETTHQAVERILEAKVGETRIFFEQLYTFDDPARDPRGPAVSVAYFALIPESVLSERLHDNIVMVPVDDIKKLAFDHKTILAKAVGRLRSKLLYSNIAYSLLPELFSLGQIQAVYETILGRTFDTRNFRKKILTLELLVATDKKTVRSSHRPATLYKFAKRGYAEFEEPAFGA